MEILSNIIDVVWYMFYVFIALFCISGIAVKYAERNNRMKAYALSDKLFIIFAILLLLTAIAGPILTLTYFILRFK